MKRKNKKNYFVFAVDFNFFVCASHRLSVNYKATTKSAKNAQETREGKSPQPKNNTIFVLKKNFNTLLLLTYCGRPFKFLYATATRHHLATTAISSTERQE